MAAALRSTVKAAGAARKLAVAANVVHPVQYTTRDLNMKNQGARPVNTPEELSWFGRAVEAWSRRLEGTWITPMLIELAGIIFNALSTLPLYTVIYAPAIAIQIPLCLTARRLCTRRLLFVAFIVTGVIMLGQSLAFTLFVNWFSFFSCTAAMIRGEDAMYLPVLDGNKCSYHLINLLILILMIICRTIMSIAITAQGMVRVRVRSSTVGKLFPRSKSTSHLLTVSDIDHKNEDTIRRRYYPEMVFTYGLFFGIIIAASVSSWVPGVKWWNVVPYLQACLIVLEADRQFFFIDVASFAPMFLNVLPMFALVVISREAHTIVSVMFFFATFLIQLEFLTIARQRTKRVQLIVVAFGIIYVLLYLVAVVFIHYFYTDATGLDQYRGELLGTPINWPEEVTIGVSLVLCGLAFSEFAKLFSFALSAHVNSIKDLASQNWRLKKQLRDAANRMRTHASGSRQQDSAHLSLDAPIQKVVGILKSLRERPEQLETEIGRALRMLSGRNLYEPHLSMEEMNAIHPELQRADTALADHPRVLERTATALTVDRRSMRSTLSRLSYISDDRMVESFSSRPASEHPRHEDLDEDIDEESAARAQEVMDLLKSYDCSMFAVAEKTGDHPIQFVGMSLFVEYGILEMYGISEDLARTFLDAIEAGYYDNPYHNAKHAADVALTFHHYLQHGLAESLSVLEVFAALVACLIHDFRHPGFTNAFQVATGSDIALQFNDNSVLENYHVASFFSLIRDEQYDIFCGLTPAERQEARRLIIPMVLATDLVDHFSLVKMFQSKVADDALDMQKWDDRLLVLKIAIKAADVSNPTKPVEVSELWSTCVLCEFYRQGDEEKRLGIPVSAFMDRDGGDLIKCQTGFIDYIVHPLFESWAKFMRHSEYIEAVSAVHTFWAGMSEEQSRELLNNLAAQLHLPFNAATDVVAAATVAAGAGVGARDPSPSPLAARLAATLDAATPDEDGEAGDGASVDSGAAVLRA